MFVIINGAPGSGKSSTAKFLFENLDKSAYVDGDWLLATTPHDQGEQRRLRYKNIASVAGNYYEGGVTTVFISFVYVRDEDLAEQVRLLSDLDSVKVFALVPSEEILRKRHLGDSYIREGIESSIKLNQQIAALNNVERIDNSEISVEEVAQLIKQKLMIQ